MKNIYKITKAQLVSIWIFGVIGFFLAVDQANYSGFATFLTVLIPALLVFYTIGWNSFNKREIVNNKPKINMSKFLPSKKKLVYSIVIIILIISIICGISYLVKIKKNKIQKEQSKQEYEKAITKIDGLKERLTTCTKPIIEKKYEIELRDCNLLKNKIKHDYTFCVSLSPVTSPASCLYENDYEKIDCSRETLINKVVPKISNTELPTSCQLIYNEFVDVSNTIKAYK